MVQFHQDLLEEEIQEFLITQSPRVRIKTANKPIRIRLLTTSVIRSQLQQLASRNMLAVRPGRIASEDQDVERGRARVFGYVVAWTDGRAWKKGGGGETAAATYKRSFQPAPPYSSTEQSANSTCSSS